jgi:hypothetical protein
MLRCGKRFVVAGIWIGISFLSGCGARSQSEISELSSVPFRQWCASSGSSNCDISASFPGTQKEWNVGLDIFAQVLASPSSIEIERKDFEHPELEELFASLGAGDLLNVVRSLPWLSLEKDLDGFLLKNEKDDAEVGFNGIKLRGAKSVVVRLIGHKIRVSGVALVESGAVRTVQALDLSKAGLVDVYTDSLTISDVPIAYFANVSAEKPSSVGPDIGRIVKAISTLAIDEDFSWRSKITLLLKQIELQKINAILKDFGPRDPISESVAGVLAASSHVMVGGEGTQVLAGVSRMGPAICEFKVVNVPVLGKLTLSLKFGNGFGLQNLRKGTGDVLVSTDVYGVETNYGKVKTLDVKANSLVMQVGRFKIPIEFEPKNPGQGGIQVASGACKEG